MVEKTTALDALVLCVGEQRKEDLRVVESRLAVFRTKNLVEIATQGEMASVGKNGFCKSNVRLHNGFRLLLLLAKKCLC